MTGNNRLRFGIFDFDPASGDLHRNGIPVRLQSQPAQVLGVLLRHAGEVVSREDLQQAIWGTETFVDFDRGLNFCVAQIRSALGDSAESPRFVRTVPKRGYQFIAPLGPAQVAEQPIPTVRLSRRQWWLTAPAAALLGGLGWWQWSKRAPLLSTRVAVARFDNETDIPRSTASPTD